LGQRSYLFEQGLQAGGYCVPEFLGDFCFGVRDHGVGAVQDLAAGIGEVKLLYVTAAGMPE
jgi:hypothetical protein